MWSCSSTYPDRRFHFGSLGSLENVPVASPTELFTPAGTIRARGRARREVDDGEGFQPVPLDLRIAGAANLPVPASNRASALALLKLTI
jgi:hypothetical protein